MSSNEIALVKLNFNFFKRRR